VPFPSSGPATLLLAIWLSAIRGHLAQSGHRGQVVLLNPTGLPLVLKGHSVDTSLFGDFILSHRAARVMKKAQGTSRQIVQTQPINAKGIRRNDAKEQEEEETDHLCVFAPFALCVKSGVVEKSGPSCSLEPDWLALGAQRPFTTRWIPSLTYRWPKLTTSPNFKPVNRRYVSNWASKIGLCSLVALLSTST
jgi:hypothetical protein